jgi:peptidoglycan L-alanyl-D-glutamate endopeptidase CwlK
MAQYGQKSQKELNTAEADLITLFNEVVKYFDNTILYGHRDPALQFELYKLGRKLENGEWIIINKSKVVTYKDGTNNLSMHNYSPSKAVDVVPYPVNFKDEDRIKFFAGYVLGTARQLKQQGKMIHDIKWGGDWNRNTLLDDETFLDYCHYEIIN